MIRNGNVNGNEKEEKYAAHLRNWLTRGGGKYDRRKYLESSKIICLLFERRHAIVLHVVSKPGRYGGPRDTDRKRVGDSHLFRTFETRKRGKNNR